MERSSAPTTATWPSSARSISVRQRRAFVLALGLGRNTREAAHQALASLDDGFDRVRAEYVQEWSNGKVIAARRDRRGARADLLRVSTAVLRTHESKQFTGGLVASLPFRGGLRQGRCTTSAATISSGRAIWWKRPAGFSAAGARTTRGASSAIWGHPGRGRSLAAEHLARWLRVLAGNPDGRDGIAHPARRPRRSGAEQRARTSFARFWPMIRRAGELPRPKRARERAGSLGGGRRILPVYGRRANRRAPRGGGPRRLDGDATAAIYCARRRIRGTRASNVDVRGRHGARPQRSASTATTCASRRRTTPTPHSPVHGFVPIKNRPSGRARSPPATSSAPMLLPSSASGCARPTIQRIATPCASSMRC